METPRIPGLEIKAGLAIMGGNPGDYKDLLSSYVAENKEKVTNLKILAEQDIKLFEIEVHSLKSTSALIGAFEISNQAKTLESWAKNHLLENIDTHLPGLIRDLGDLIFKIESWLSATAMTDNKPEGDIPFFVQKMCAIKNAMENYDRETASRVRDEVEIFAWDPDHSALLGKVSVGIQNYAYREVLEILADYDG